MSTENADDGENTIIPQQDLITVYTNTAGAVVIKQYVGDEQPFVYVHRHHLPALIKKLQSYLPTGER